jgi:hypothetical protein
MPTPRSNIFHDLHHETERTIARTKQACRELETFLEPPSAKTGPLKKRRIAERDGARFADRRPH